MRQRSGRVLVYGDAMLDTMADGQILRMSPEEASAPVVKIGEIAWAPGGAANVAVNVQAMGGAAALMAPVGADPVGGIVEALVEKAGVGTALMPRSGVRTTTKLRIMVSGRQLVRLDSEDERPLTTAEEDVMVGEVTSTLRASDVLVISDYAKGAVTPRMASTLIATAASLDIPSIVDAKDLAQPHFLGATVLKPNLTEIARALQCEEPQTDAAAAECAHTLRRMTGATFVVLTRGAHGVCLVGMPGELHIAGHPVAAVDVTGAGDAVAAGLALALARGEGIVEAARFANAAGAVAVTKRGTAAPSRDEIVFFYDCDVGLPRTNRQRMEGAGTQGRLH